MTNLLIITLCTLAGSFALTVVANGHDSNVRSDRIIVASIGAASGLVTGLAIVGLIATIADLL